MCIERKATAEQNGAVIRLDIRGSAIPHAAVDDAQGPVGVSADAICGKRHVAGNIDQAPALRGHGALTAEGVEAAQACGGCARIDQQRPGDLHLPDVLREQSRGAAIVVATRRGQIVVRLCSQNDIAD